MRARKPFIGTALAAVRTRVLRSFAADLGGKALSHRHVAALDALVTDWHGQRRVDLPGQVHASRSGGSLRLARGPVTG